MGKMVGGMGTSSAVCFSSLSCYHRSLSGCCVIATACYHCCLLSPPPTGVILLSLQFKVLFTLAPRVCGLAPGHRKFAFSPPNLGFSPLLRDLQVGSNSLSGGLLVC